MEYGAGPPTLFENNDLVEANYLHDNTTLLTNIAAINALGSGFSGNFSAEPGFAPDSRHLAANSACVNAGTADGAPVDDFEGDPRDSTPDVGADEWNASVPANPCIGACSGHGSCHLVDGAAACTCSYGWVGPDCASADLCLAFHGGCDPLTTCTGFPGGRTCSPCPPGYAGSGETGCTPVGCAGNPCKNEGTCTPTPDGNHTCSCPFGVTGASCELYFTAVAAGDGFTCGLRNDKRIVCFGRDDQGQTEVPPGDYIAVSAGRHDACAVRSDGTLACWGSSSQGVTSPPPGSFSSVSVGDNYACALNGAYAASPTCWGALGPAPSASYNSIVIGDWHARGIRGDRVTECWGVDDSGQATPPANVTFQALSAGATTSCGIDVDRSVRCWGSGFGSASPPSSGWFSTIGINDSSGCALDSTEILSCWGDDPKLPSDYPAGTLRAFSLGAHHGCGLSNTALYCWGDNTYGELTPY